MFKDFKAILFYLTFDFRFSLIVFWSILFASMITLFLIGNSFEGTNILFSSGFSVYVYCAISGFLITKETFPYCVKLGSTRNTYFLGAIVFNGLLALFMALIHLAALSLFKWFVELSQMDNMSIIFTVEKETLLATLGGQLLLDTVIGFVLLSVGFLLSSAFYRLGMVGGIAGIALLGIMLIMPAVRNWLIDLFLTAGTSDLNINYTALILVALVAMIPNWLLLKNAPTTPGVTR
jgi:ABC-2 type transport system permease protein